MRIGIFGGSFDPIHIGHLWIAESAIEHLDLHKMIWIPAATSPLKLHGATASSDDRLEMVRLAISGDEKHEVDDREIKRGDVSYTVDTFGELKAEYADDELFLIIGGDSLATIEKWERPQELLQLASLSVVRRGGEAELDYSVLESLTDPDHIQRIRSNELKMPLIEISSSELRSRIARKRSIRYRTPRSVEALISAKGLYRQ